MVLSALMPTKIVKKVGTRTIKLATAIANLGLGMLEANTTKTILKIEAPRVLKIRERLIKENNLFRKASFIKISFSNEWFERFFKNSQ